jgi:hypothetical protein
MVESSQSLNSPALVVRSSSQRPAQAIIHVGFDKTGTTAIQQFCDENRDCLRKNNIHYPKPLRDEEFSHVAFAKELGFQWNDAADQQAFKDCGKLLRGPLTPENETLLLSTEAFCYYTSVFPIQKLKGWLNNNGYWQIKIILYLRNQVDWLTALYAEGIRWGNIETLDKFYSQARGRFFYLKFISEWATIFGSEAIILRNYDGNSLLSDFSNITQMPPEIRQKALDFKPFAPNYTMPQIISEYIRQSPLTQNGSERYDFLINRLSTIKPRFLPSTFGQKIWTLPSLFLQDIFAFQSENQLITEKYGPTLWDLPMRVNEYSKTLKPMEPKDIEKVASLLIFELICSKIDELKRFQY